ncbi:MAG: topoisomerase C-terminal repeat-containing protein [Clostridia bacterium]|nr:topoisomerase C-terminal repeat-containing protein [Clostridia bacterium]
MILIIAEKPSLGRNICDAIGNMKKQNGYYEGENYIVTWALGHLFQLFDVEDYTGEENVSWRLDNLPFYPENFRYKLRPKGKSKNVDPGVEKQFKIIERLCNRSDVDKIVNAGDADREGEIIIRLCIDNALKTKKELCRLWLPDQTRETIQSELSALRNSNDYNDLAAEGFSRTFVDWLYGINLTRYATLKSGSLLRVGRVIIPIVKAIYDRDMAIRNFVPTTYYGIVSKADTKGETVELVSTRKYAKEELEKAMRCCKAYNDSEAVVTGRTSKKETLSPGKLFSLSKLQNLLAKKYKMSMDTSLKIVQDLYEKGYLTYPRTNSEYLATAEKGKISKIIDNIAAVGYPVKFKDKKTIFDDSKIESHSALTPTFKIPKKDALSEDEYKVYQTVFRRFVAVFCSEDCIAQKTEIKVKVGEYEEFTLKGTVILEKGWTKFEDPPSKNKVLPDLKKGDIVNIDFQPKEKETTPPKHHTVESLNNFLKNPYRDIKEAAKESESEDDMEEYKAIFEGVEIGTEATRTGIIKNAQDSGYIELKNNSYYILNGGIFLIETLQRLGINMEKEKTAHLGRALKQVYRREITVNDCVMLAQAEISEVFGSQSALLPPDEDRNIGTFRDKVGVCPLCGKDVIRGKYSYGCMGYKDGCKFKISLEICKRTIPISAARDLLTNGRTVKLKGFISKNGKPFDGSLRLDGDKVVFDFN